MPTGVRIYRWDQTGAPPLTNSAGEIRNILRACLVDGFGSQPAAGWTEPFSGTNKSVFRQGGGSQFYFRIDDTDPLEWSPVRSKFGLRGGEGASSVDTLVDEFGNANVFRCGDHAGEAKPGPHRWIVLADDRTVHLFQSELGLSFWTWCPFGQIYSRKPGDIYGCHSLWSVGRFDSLNWTSAPNATGPSDASQLVLARLSDGITKNQKAGVHVRGAPYQTVADLSNGVWAYPTVIYSAGNLPLTRIHTHEISIQEPRGYLRGIYWTPCVTSNFANFDTFSGDPAGPLAGRTFMILKNISMPGATNPGSFGQVPSEILGAYVIETSDTWDTN